MHVKRIRFLFIEIERNPTYNKNKERINNVLARRNEVVKKGNMGKNICLLRVNEI